MAAAAFTAFLLASAASLPSTPSSPDTGPEPSLVCDPCRAIIDANTTHFEPFVAVSPHDPNHLVAASSLSPSPTERGRFSVHASFDGGLTWTASSFPFGQTAPEDHPLRRFESAFDPVVAILPSNTVLLAGVARVPDPEHQLGPLEDALFAARSTDGGLSFPNAVILHEEPPTPGPTDVDDGPSKPWRDDSSDKPWFGLGPSGEVVLAYVVLDQLDPRPDLDRLLAAVGQGPSALAQEAQATGTRAVFTLDILVTSSEDDGGSWREPEVLVRGSQTEYNYPAYPLLGSDGAWRVLTGTTASSDPVLFESSDEGHTWEARQLDGVPGAQWGAATLLRDPDGDTLVYGYQHPSSETSRSPRLATSGDHGRTWDVFELTEHPVSADITTFFATVAIDGNGTAYMLHYIGGDSEPLELRLTAVTPAGTIHSRVLESDLDGVGGGRGHYLGLTGLEEGAYAVWPSGPKASAELVGARLVIEG